MHYCKMHDSKKKPVVRIAKATFTTGLLQGRDFQAFSCGATALLN